MTKPKKRFFSLDGDTVEVIYYYDESCGKYLGDYPDFESHPRYTPTGRPWVDVTMTGCEFSETEEQDCGSCRYLQKEKTNDIIGICVHERRRLAVSGKDEQ